MAIGGFVIIPNATAYSTSYSFQLNSMVANCFIELDGSVTIQYNLTITNNPGAKPIDWLDIAFPNKDYNINSVTASENGTAISKSLISPSTAIAIGVQIDLRSHPLLAGQSAQFYVQGNNPNMIYGDYENQSMDSVEFYPTQFDPSYCPTYQYLQVNIFFPPNSTNGNLVKYHYSKYDSYDTNVIIGNNHYLKYTWNKTNAPMQEYKYGVSFPKSWVDVSIGWTANPVLVNFVVDTLLVVSIVGLVAGISYFIYRYFHITRKRYYPPKKVYSTGGDKIMLFCCSAFFGALLIAAFWSTFSNIMLIIGFFAIVIAGFGMIGYLIYKLISNRKKPYSKPNISIECVGVKKGLSVVEAAVIKNTPLNKVMFLIIFGLIKESRLKITDNNPLKFEILSEENIKELPEYQSDFLKAIIKDGPRKGEIAETKLRTLLIDLITKTYNRMKGHDLDATILYYDNMINKAWETVKKLPNEIQWKDIENEYSWLMLDNLFEQRSQTYFANRYYSVYPYWYPNYYYYPYFWNRGYYYSYYPRLVGPNARIGSVAAPMNHINIGMFSNTMVRGMESISNRIVTNFSNFAETIVNKVRPTVRSTSSGRSGGGHGYSGGGCACACACACAGCACACAGGGR